MRKQEKPWNRLEKAIRAADQILQSAARVVVLDLAFVPQELALRIPSATWFRFRRAAQESDAIFLLLTQAACARSSAQCVLDCSAGVVSSSTKSSQRLIPIGRSRSSTFEQPIRASGPGSQLGSDTRIEIARRDGSDGLRRDLHP